MKQKLVAAIYARKSVILKKGDTLNIQEDKCRENLKLRYKYDYDLTIKCFTDEKTGKDMDREEMQSMIEQIKEGKVQVVCAYKLDRFGRNAIELVNFIELLKKYNVKLHCVDDQINYDPTDDNDVMTKLMIRMEKLLVRLSGRIMCLTEQRSLKLQGLVNGNERYILEGIIIVLIAAYIFYENVFMAVILSPYVYIHYRQRIKERIVHDKKNFKKKFKDGIIAVSFALNVGYSIENAFGQAVDELTLMYGDDSDIVVKFKLIVIRLGQNENLEDILDDFAEESKVEDIMYFAEIFRYAKRSGGDLMAVIKNTAQIIQQKEEVMSEVDTIISGKKMEQRVMSLIPAVIVIYLKVTAKEFIQPLYGNIAGIIIMTVCLAVYVVSDMWAKRIVNIEV